jgi:transcription elongation factor Elf1
MMEEPRALDQPSSLNKPFCPFCFMQQFDVTEASQGTVYCDNCGIDVPVKDLVKL